MSETVSNSPLTIQADILNICLESLEEVKKAYTLAHQLSTRVIELEKVATVKEDSIKNSPKIDTELVDQTVKNLVASSFLEREHSVKLANEIKSDPSVALRLVQRFIEISTPPFSEGQGVAKAASEDSNLGDPDGWSRILSQGA